MSLIYNRSDEFCAFAGRILMNDADAFKPAVGVGVERDGKILAVVIYNNYALDKNGNPLLIEMSIISIDKRWCTRHNLRALFAYPFVQLRLKRVQALCSAQDEGVQMFLKKLGFKREGVHRLACRDGGDAVSFGMLKHECKWLEE